MISGVFPMFVEAVGGRTLRAGDTRHRESFSRCLSASLLGDLQVGRNLVFRPLFFSSAWLRHYE